MKPRRAPRFPIGPHHSTCQLHLTKGEEMQEIAIRNRCRFSSIMSVVCLTIFASVALAQQPPTERKGTTGKVLTTMDLAPEIDGMQGRVLRMRMTTIEPGGTIGLHDHKDRPSVIYLLEGALTEHRGGVMRDLGQGDVISQGKDSAHAIENRGATPAAFIEVEVIKQPKE